MLDLANYSEKETLKNGAAVLIRRVRADDKNRFSAAFHKLETESIYTRFFHHKKTLTEDELKSATEVDFENVVALVVTTGKEITRSLSGADATCSSKAPAVREERRWPLRSRKITTAKELPGFCCVIWLSSLEKKECPTLKQRSCLKTPPCSPSFHTADFPCRRSFETASFMFLCR